MRKHFIHRLFISALYLLLFITIIPWGGCNWNKDHSMRSGSYQAEHTESEFYLAVTFYMDGTIRPDFYLGNVRMIRGDYRAMLKMDNPTFSEDALVELLDQNKKLMGEYEIQFWQRPADDDPQVKILAYKGVKRKNLRVETIYIPYSEEIAWFQIKDQLIRLNHNKIIIDYSNSPFDDFKHSY